MKDSKAYKYIDLKKGKRLSKYKIKDKETGKTYKIDRFKFCTVSMLEQIQAVIDLMKAPLTQKLSSTILKSIMMNLIVLIIKMKNFF